MIKHHLSRQDRAYRIGDVFPRESGSRAVHRLEHTGYTGVYVRRCGHPQPALKQFARLVLRKRYTDVAIDDMLKSDSLTYADLARMAQDDAAAIEWLNFEAVDNTRIGFDHKKIITDFINWRQHGGTFWSSKK